MPDTPTIFEWLALIQQDPAQARKLMITIKARDKIQGLFADPALTISVEEYDEAQRLLAAAAGDPAIARRAAHMARLGQATMGPSPDRAAWQALIAADPDFRARSVHRPGSKRGHAGATGAAGAAAQRRDLPRARGRVAALARTRSVAV